MKSRYFCLIARDCTDCKMVNKEQIILNVFKDFYFLSTISNYLKYMCDRRNDQELEKQIAHKFAICDFEAKYKKTLEFVIVKINNTNSVLFSLVAISFLEYNFIFNLTKALKIIFYQMKSRYFFLIAREYRDYGITNKE